MATRMMQAAVLHGIGDLRVESVPSPGAPAPYEVKVQINRVGICGSDVHYWQNGRIGDFVVREPMILGHECSGTVVEVGTNVTYLQPGHRVAIEPGVPRGSTPASNYYLKKGEYNLCPDIFFFATPPDHGAFCEFLNHPADFCFKLPDHVSLEEGAMIEPLSTGIYAARVAPIRMGDTVIVTGAGPIGLMNVLTALAAGAANVIVSDPVEARLRVAKEIGATHTSAGHADELKQLAAEATDGRGADVAIECAGHPSALNACIGAARAGATVVLIGLPPEDVATLNVTDMIVREIKLRPIFRYNNTFPTGVELLASGRVNVKPLLSATFALQQTAEAFAYVVAHRDSCVKAIVEVF